MAVTPFSLSQRKSRRSSARRMASLGRPAKSASMRVEHDALGADLVDHACRGGRTGLPGRTRRSPRSRCARCGRSRWPASCGGSGRRRSKPSEATFLASSSAVSSKAMKTPGSSNSRDAADDELHAPAASCRSRRRRRPAWAGPRAGRRSVISSRPRMPVGHFSNAGKGLAGLGVLLFRHRRLPLLRTATAHVAISGSANRRKCLSLMHLSLAYSIPDACSGPCPGGALRIHNSRENTLMRLRVREPKFALFLPSVRGLFHRDFRKESRAAMTYNRRTATAGLRNFPNFTGT